MGLEAVGLHDVLGTEAKQQAGLSCQPCVLTRLSQQTGVRVRPEDTARVNHFKLEEFTVK